MADSSYPSWGRWPRSVPAQVHQPSFRSDALGLDPAISWLPRGNGRSYGDCCLNHGGGLIDTRRLDRFMAFDPEQGLLTAEAGVLLSDILELTVPRGWFLAVTPGTKFVTLGGAIANDVHGKDHHSAGTFGEWVRSIELRRSDDAVLTCSPAENAGLFRATIGGMGLTGLILSATIQLRPIAFPGVLCETLPFESLDEFLAIDAIKRREKPLTAAWVDCLAKELRGAYLAGDFAPAPGGPTEAPAPPATRKVPVTPPFSVLSGPAMGLFNTAYFHASRRKRGIALVGLDQFFYPLDAVLQWNRLYGPQGFVQLQFVVPFAAARPVLTEIFAHLRQAGLGSFLAVIKSFGGRPPAGLMSFPMEGVTLAIDLPRTAGLARALEYADGLVREAGGRFYAAKDSYSSPASFRQGYPELEQFVRYLDPALSSDLWRRVTGRVSE